jgi:prepilin-type N-terminal cleavage/methylation domain
MKTARLPRRASRPGFTLIELLTVIAIIGILAAILVPVVGRVRQSARSSQCVSNLRQIGVAIHLHADEHKDELPRTWGPSERVSGVNVDFSHALHAYLPLRGPAAATSPAHEVFVCPAADFGGLTGLQITRAYGAAGGMIGLHSSGSHVTNTLGRRRADIRTERTRTPWVLDTVWQASTYSWAEAHWWGGVRDDAMNGTSGRLDFRHGDKLNILLADGGVRPFTRAAILAFFTDRSWDGR